MERAVELVPAHPPSVERGARRSRRPQLIWCREESLAICEQALELARAVGARSSELRSLQVLGSNLAYLGRTEEGPARVRQALQLAEERGDPLALD